MAQSARVFVGRPVSSASSLHTFLSFATAKFFVVHSKLKRTLANALSPSLHSFRICGGVSLAPCSSPRTCCLTFDVV